VTKVLAVYSNKGGVGKTTTAVNLGYLAAQSGYRTLLCDLDAQSSATFFLRIKPKLKRKARGLPQRKKWLRQSIKETDYENFDLLPGDFSHRHLDVVFEGRTSSRLQLKQVLKVFRSEYDLILLDCPPSFNILAENIFQAVSTLLVPLVPTPLNWRAYEHMITFLAKSGKRPTQQYTFFSLVDQTNSLHLELATRAYHQFSNVLRNPIFLSTDTEAMGVHRQPVSVFAPDSVAAQGYQALWNEVADRILEPSRL
jgi:cellulose biosynthesis protein BcsQ